jgi:GAF domain-containing protein
MFQLSEINPADKPAFYAALNRQLELLLYGESDLIANMANAASLLYFSLPAINWAGFYLLKDGELVLGPFHGKPACVRIKFGKGVCGTAAASGKIQRVDDVHLFPGHIACDADSRSEIVIPLFAGQKLLGVMDIDSPQTGRFTEEDQAGLEKFTGILLSGLI